MWGVCFRFLEDANKIFLVEVVGCEMMGVIKPNLSMKKLFLGIKGHVLCVDQDTGREEWRTKLRSSTITNVVCVGELLHAYSRGHLFALDPKTGDVLWENSLNGLGYGFCIIASEGDRGYVQSASAIQAQQAAASASVVAATAANTNS